MSQPVVLEVAEVSKRYASYRSSLHRFANWFGMSIKPASEFWAVREISFQLKSGESIALIGQNGAGKSTLLKLITGTIQPTTGRIHHVGRVSAILELGLGFNPEFTGRENIYQAGGLLGHPRELLDQLVPEIEDFIEIGEHFDKPLRTYSSGMQARLAFALATAVRPDVLIVDEVLSVGDSYFQHKSFGRINQFKEAGTSLLLVTHAMADVRSLCDRVLLLDRGQVLKDGPPDEVVDYYNALIAAKEQAKLTVEQRREKDGWLRTRSGTFEVLVEELKLVGRGSEAEVAMATVGQELELRVRAVAKSDVERLVLGLLMRDRTGHVVWGTNTWHTKQIVESVKAGDVIDYAFGFTANLGIGSYSFSIALVNSESIHQDTYEWHDNALVFDVINTNYPFFVGSCRLPGEFVISRR